MTSSTISPEMRRFVLTSIPSVPHLEALLLLHNESFSAWSCARLAQRLYVSEKTASTLLEELAAAGVVEAVAEAPQEYRYHPRSAELRHHIDELAATYSKHLVEITNLIHSTTDRKAHQFADAFKLRKDP